MIDLHLQHVYGLCWNTGGWQAAQGGEEPESPGLQLHPGPNEDTE